MRLSAVLLLLCLFTDAGARETLDLRYTASAAIDADGRVSAVEFRGELPEAVRVPLEQRIRSWEFEPARVDGEATASLTHLRIHVQADPVDGGDDRYALRIVDADNGPLMANYAAPRIPRDRRLFNSPFDAVVVLGVQFSADGKPGETTLQEYRASRDGFRDPLVAASIDAVRQWTFVPEQVDGAPVAGSVSVPVGFCVSRTTCTPPEPDPADATARRFKPGQQLIADAPVARLKTDVVGQSL